MAIKMNFNDEQKKAIESEKPLVLISAGAGSGKTRVLTERFLYLCNKKLREILGDEKPGIGAEVKEIVAITFTEKAAREMKKRIRERINSELLEGENLEEGNRKEKTVAFWKEQREAVDSGFITTFHSFCHKLLHQFAFKANLSPSFSVMDDTKSKLLKNQTFNEIFSNDKNHNSWRLLYKYYSKRQLKDSVLRIYDQIQENPKYDVNGFIESLDIELSIDNQLQFIEKFKKNILISFYEQARECVEQFPSVGSVKGKLAVYLPKVSDHVENINLDELKADECFKLICEVIPTANGAWKESAPSFYELCFVHLKSLKESFKKYQGFPTEKLEDFCKIIGLFSDVLMNFHMVYQQKKEERAALDFADLQKKAIGLLRDEEDIRTFCQREYKHIMVDEFQDTNGLQMGMLEYIKPHNRFIVGDGKQSIYRFRGADVTLMNTLEDEIKGDPRFDFIDMGKNYRNCDSIIQFVNELFKGLMVKTPDTMGFGINYNPLISNRNEEFETHPHKKVELLVLHIEDGADGEYETEFDLLTERMLEIYNKGSEIVKDKVKIEGQEKDVWRSAQWRDFAILLPSRTGLGDLEKRLNNKNIPYVVHGGIGFYQKQEIKDMLNLLRFIARPWESVYILGLLRGPVFQLNMEDFFTINNCLDEERDLPEFIFSQSYKGCDGLTSNLKDKLDSFYELFVKYVPLVPQQSFKETLMEIFEGSGLKTTLLLQKNPLQLVKNVEKLIDVMSSQNAHSLEELLEQVDILAQLSDKEGEAEAEIPEGNMVNIMTVHASKGLEFPIVCLPKLNRKPKSDSEYFYYDEESHIVAKFKEENNEDPFEMDEFITPCYGLVQEKDKVAALEESKRLFYVGTTRARDYLIMSTTDKKTNNTWYSMFNSCLETNDKLNEYVVLKTQGDVPRQNAAMLEEDVFMAQVNQGETQTPYTFSVSEIMLFINDPQKYYDEYILKVNPDWFKVSGSQTYTEKIIAGSEFGTIVHRACELLDQGFSQHEAVEESLGFLDDDEVVNLEEYSKEVFLLLEKYKEIQGLDIGEHVVSEYGFATEIAGAYVVGEIDKVYEKDGYYHLMDLKTNIINDEDDLIQKYMPQIYLYKLAYEQENNVEVKEVSLFFMRLGKNGLKTLSPNGDYENQVKEAILKMSELKRNNAGRSQYRAEII